MRRVTIRDIARIAEVSPGAVSLALNDKPGVSDETRQRIVEIASRIGWTPSAAAKALSSSKASTVGLVLARPRASIDWEHFYFRFICGVEQVLTDNGQGFLLQIADDVNQECDVYRDWWSQRRVDAVFMVDPRLEDPRPAVLRGLGLPFVSVGAMFEGAKAVVVDDTAMETALSHLAEQGCRRVAYVCGLPSTQHTFNRVTSFREHATALGMEPRLSNYTNYSEDAGAHETSALLQSASPPDAIVYDNEILTIGGLETLSARNLRWPADVRVVSMEDSPICRVLNPQITALARDPLALGATAAEVLLHGGADEIRRIGGAQLMVRGSTRADAPSR